VGADQSTSSPRTICANLAGAATRWSTTSAALQSRHGLGAASSHRAQQLGRLVESSSQHCQLLVATRHVFTVRAATDRFVPRTVTGSG
jgi:hypothetical protein